MKKTPLKLKPADLLIVAVFFAILIGTGYLLNGLFAKELEPGNVDILLAKDQRVLTLRRITAAPGESGGQTEWERFEITRDGPEFPEISFSGNLTLTTDIDPWGSMYYTLYDGDFTELYYRSERFSPPEDPGRYYLVIDTMWGDKKKYFSTQHGVQLLVE